MIGSSIGGASALPDCDGSNPPPICSGDEGEGPRLPPVRGTPTGSLDTASRVPAGVEVSGIASDPDASGPVEVLITIASEGGAAATVGQLHADGTGGAFNGIVRAQPGTAVCAIAVNRNRGADVSLGCRQLSVGFNPVGVLDLAASEAGPHIRLHGWAYDPDTTDPIDVHIYVNDAFYLSTKADHCCQGNTNAAYGTAHVVALNLPIRERGRYTVCAYGINVGPGDTNSPLGCKQVTHIGLPNSNIDMPVGEELSLESLPQPGKLIRIDGDSEKLAFRAVDGMTELDVRDARFKKVQGLSNADCASFESVRFPGRFIRHLGNRLVLHQGGIFAGTEFNADATFCRRDVLRYEAVNKPGYYMRDNGAFVLARIDDWTDQNAVLDTFFHEIEPATLGMNVVGSFEVDGQDHVRKASGACTGFGPPLTDPPDLSTLQCTGMLLVNSRTGETRQEGECAIGLPFAAFYPWMTTHERPDRPVYWIEKGRRICLF